MEDRQSGRYYVKTPKGQKAARWDWQRGWDRRDLEEGEFVIQVIGRAPRLRNRRPKISKLYIAGEWVGGFFEGKFSSQDEAWSHLSRRYLVAYPHNQEKTICMFVWEENQYGIEQAIKCVDWTQAEANDLPADEVCQRAKRTYNRLR